MYWAALHIPNIPPSSFLLMVLKTTLLILKEADETLYFPLILIISAHDTKQSPIQHCLCSGASQKEPLLTEEPSRI